jgi:predicted nucleic acid-binding protein
VLDTGAILALVRGDVRVAAALRVAHARGDEVIVPPVVVAQVLRGSATDAPIHRFLHVAHVTFVGLRLARIAGALLGRTGLRDAADALIMAEVLRGTPALLLTSDPHDMAQLAAGYPGITILAV